MPQATPAMPVEPVQRAAVDGSDARVQALAAGAKDRLNLFQHMMLRWRALHPYNPVHVVSIPAAVDMDRLRRGIAKGLEQRGLSGLWVAPDGRRFRFMGGPAEVQLEASPATLDATIEREMNRPFSDPSATSGRLNPFRFVVVAAPEAFKLVLAYDHFVASGDSIARLLTDIALGYLAADAAAVPRSPAPAGRTYRSLFLRHPGWTLRAVLGLPRLAARMRRASRPPGMFAADASNGFVQCRIKPAQLQALVAACKAWGVNVNDLLLAALMLALAPLARSRQGQGRRNELAVASILNMRKDFQGGAGDALSPFLAAFQVGHAMPEGIGLRELVSEVHAVTAPIRDKRLYLRSILALGLSSLVWPLLTAERQRGLYAKHFPVWGGVTGLNLEPIWAQRGAVGTECLDYLRVVPTGPLCPLVMAATSVNGHMHIGIAYRKTVFGADVMARLAQDVRGHLDLSSHS